MKRTTLLVLLPTLAIACATAPEPGEANRQELSVGMTPAPVDAGAADLHPAPATAPDASGEVGVRAPETWGGMGFKEINEKQWLAETRRKVAEQYKVEPAALLFSPGKLRVAFVRDPAQAAPPARKAPARPRPRRFQIVVVDNQGRPVATFRPVTARGSDEPPKDLRFLSEDRIIYEVVSPPQASSPKHKIKRAARPQPRKSARRAAKRGVTGPATVAAALVPDQPTTPPQLFVIQMLQPRARPVRCVGRHFSFAPQNKHVAFVGGSPRAAFVAVDDAQVYPRRGRAEIPSTVAWSKDGRSLAFVEVPEAGPPRLVLLAEYDNPTGDTTWELPHSAPLDGIRVFWAGAGRLVVGKTVTRPVFSASFQKQLPSP